MKNFIQTGSYITVPAPADVKSGDLVFVGALFGIADNDAPSGAPCVLCTEGVYTLPKTSAQAWTVGVAIYWDGSEATTTATDMASVISGASSGSRHARALDGGVAPADFASFLGMATFSTRLRRS